MLPMPPVRRGFTLIELIIVIAIIAIIAAVVVVAIDPAKRLNAAKDSARLHNAQQIEDAINRSYADTGTMPAGIPSGSAIPICRTGISNAGCLNLDTALASYLKKMPVDDAETNVSFTGYAVATQNAVVTVTPMHLSTASISLSPTDYVSYWNLDENAGTVAADRGSAHAQGTLTGSPAWAAGASTLHFTNVSALDFNGSNYVSAAGPNINGAAAATLSLWMKTATAQTNKYLLSLPFNSGGSDGFDLALADGTHVASYLRTTVGGGAGITGAATYTNGVWHHIAATYDGSTQTLYFDGAVLGSRSVTGTIQTNGSEANIARFGSLGANATATIDDFRIYTRALTPSEIQLLANGY